MLSFVGVAVAFGYCRETYGRTQTDTEMFAVVERLVHIAVRRESRAEFAVIAEVEVACPYTDGSVVPLLETMPSAGRQELHGELTSQCRTLDERVYFAVRHHHGAGAAYPVCEFIMGQGVEFSACQKAC